MLQIKTTNSKLLLVLTVVLGWTAYGLFFASQAYMQKVYSGRQASLQADLVVWLTCALAWAILTPAVLWFVRRRPFTPSTWFRVLPVHLLAAVGLSLFHLALYQILRVAEGVVIKGNAWEFYRELVIDELHADVVVYFAVIGCWYLITLVLFPRPHAHDDGPLNETVLPALSAPASEAKQSAANQRNIAAAAFVSRFTVKENGRIVFINADVIDMITSEGNYVKLHVNGRSHMLRDTMNAVAQKLNPKQFVRLRRSTIVRFSAIKELRPLFNGEFEVLLTNGSTALSSRRYRKNLESFIKT